MKPLTSKERLLRQLRGQEIDRIPMLGGWIGGALNLASLAGITPEAYLTDPLQGAIRAHRALEVDGMIQPIYPTQLDQIRNGSVTDSSFSNVQPEALVERANAYPDSEKAILAQFDRPRAEQQYRAYFEGAFSQWEGIEPIPNFWELGGLFPLYHEFGYSAFLMACALYPEAVGKIWWARSIESRERAKIMAGLYQEFNLVPLMFCGEDLANNKGPMVSPAFLRRYYYPTVKMIIAPLLEAGVRLVHHCDGDVRPLIGDFLEMGFSGLQGFQYELGIDLYELNQFKTPSDEALIFFTGLNVTRTLPYGTVEDVRQEVEYCFDATDGGRGLFLFTSSLSGTEVPVENIQAAYSHVKTLTPRQPRTHPWKKWPWSETHNENS